MSDQTLLDQSIAALAEAPADEGLQRMFYDRLSGSDLLVLLEAEATGDAIRPQTLDHDGQPYVLVFDRAERLAEFAGGAAPFAGLPGKDLCALLAPSGLGIALNPQVSAHPQMMPPADVAWVADTLNADAQTVAAKLTGVRAPDGVPDGFYAALTARFAAFEGAAELAAVVRAGYEDGAERILVGFVEAHPAQEPALAASVQDAVALLMPHAAVDVGFFAPDHHIAAALMRQGVVLKLPKAPSYAPTAPGMDPANPPKL